MSNEKNQNIDGATEKILERLSLDATFSKLLERANSIQDGCEDFIVETPKTALSMRPDLMLTLYDGKNHQHFPLSEHAFGQLCTKLEIPARYMKRCLKDGEPDLVEDSFNTWLDRYESPLLLRAHEGKLRGILSTRFSMLDAPDILSGVSDISNDFKVKGSYLSPERLHVRLTERTRLPIEGEDLFPGIQIDSSDVGRRLLNVRFFIFKQVCTNGLVLPIADFNLFSQKHMGLTSAEFSTSFCENLSRFSFMKEEATKIILRGKEEVLTAKALESILESTLRQVKLPEDTSERVISFMESKYPMNRFGLVNSLTEIAQDFTLDRRLEIEEAAGSVLLKVA